jgi:uncharacterized membrane protein
MSVETAPDTTPTSRAARRSAPQNVGPAERWLSLAIGVAALWLVRKRGGLRGWTTRAVASALLARGATGYSEAYGVLGIDTASAEHRSSAALRRARRPREGSKPARGGRPARRPPRPA